MRGIRKVVERHTEKTKQQLKVFEANNGANTQANISACLLLFPYRQQYFAVVFMSYEHHCSSRNLRDIYDV